MKGAQLATLVWLGNLLVLAGGGMIGYKYYTGIETERTDVYEQVSRKTKLEKTAWQEQGISANATALRALNPTLSPRSRPRAPVKPIDTPPPPPPKEPTDEELQAELQKWVNEQFTLVYALAPGTAKMTPNEGPLKGKSVFLFPGMKFKEEFTRPLVEEHLKALAKYDFTVVSIHSKQGQKILEDHVVINAPSIRPKYANKYFDVALMMSKEAAKELLSKVGRTLTGDTSRIPLPKEEIKEEHREAEKEPVDTRPKTSTYDQKTDTWQLGTEDFARPEVLDEMARYARVVQDAQGKAIGIQITDDVPEDSVLVRRGGRRGDIIKSINGNPVTSVAQARAVGRKLYVDQGVTNFEVGYERDGVPGVKRFTLPPKKK
jgi:hypothetical protein